MLDRLSAYELAEWEAYNMLDPIGEVREDFRNAMLSCLITNIAIKWASGKKTVKLSEIADFLPQWDVTAPKEVKKQSMEEMKKALKEIAKAQNEAVEKKKKLDALPPPNIKKKGNG